VVPVPTGLEAEGDPEPDWTTWREEKSCPYSRVSIILKKRDISLYSPKKPGHLVKKGHNKN
jgi:hypothetical protein